MFLSGFFLLTIQLYMEVIVQNKYFVFSCPLPSDIHEIKQRDVWNYLRKKTQSWKAELNDWVGEFENLVGSPDPTIFEDPNEKKWVDPLESWEVRDDNQSEKIKIKKMIAMLTGHDSITEITTKIEQVTESSNTFVMPTSTTETVSKYVGGHDSTIELMTKTEQVTESVNTFVTPTSSAKNVYEYVGSGDSENTSPVN